MKYQKQRGFTLVEIIAVLGIFMVLTSIVVFNYSKFRSDTVLTNMAYEVALTIREAQIYGVSARSSGVSFENAYGIFIPTSSSNQYSVYSDGNGDLLFSGDDCLLSGGDTCVTTYNFQNSIKISQLDVKIGGSCQPASTLSISFKRPNPEPIIRRNSGNEAISLAQITVSTEEGTDRYVVIYGNGQVAVLNESQCN